MKTSLESAKNLTETKRRLSLSDIALENSEALYVIPETTKLYKAPSSVLLDHRSSQDHQIRTIEIPNTWIPFNLADFAPKEELVRNSQLMQIIAKGLVRLVSTKEAEAILSRPDAAKEMDRLIAERMSHVGAQEELMNQDSISQTVFSDIDSPAKGDIGETASGVSGAVYDLFTAGRSDEDRIVALRNLISILTEAEKRFIRSQTNNPEILSMISG